MTTRDHDVRNVLDRDATASVALAARLWPLPLHPYPLAASRRVFCTTSKAKLTATCPFRSVKLCC